MDLLKPVRCPITNADVGFYDTYGFLIVENILSPVECEKLLKVFEYHADENFSAIMNPDREIHEARAIMRSPGIVDAIEKLQRWEVDAVMSQFLFKRAGSPYQAQAWNPHQDNSYPKVPYPGYITVNVFLEDADTENGCMYMYPGSHREPLLPFVGTESYREKTGSNPGNSIEVPPEYKKVDLVVKKGSIFIMNGHLIHGSYPNKSATRSRALFSFSYVTKGVEFLIGQNANRIRIPVR